MDSVLSSSASVEMGSPNVRECANGSLGFAPYSVLTETAASREALIRDGNVDRAKIGIVMSESYLDFRERGNLVRQVMRVCLPRERAVELTGLGTLILRPAVHAIDADRLSHIRRSCEEALIECAGTSALLLVEGAFALGAVNAILGCQSATAARSLSRIERGILHGLLATLSARLGLSSTVRVCPEDRRTAMSDSIVIEISLRLREATGRAWLCATDEFLARMLTTQSMSVGCSSTAVCLDLGRTRVPVSELADAREGDAVVFDGVAALVAEDPWPVHFRLGDCSAPASLRSDGVVVGEGTDGRDCGASTKVEQRATIPLARPDAVVGDPGGEVTAVLARLDGVALVGLLGGAPLAQGRGQSVLLRLEDAPWAEGEIFAVDGEFAVRITRKLAG